MIEDEKVLNYILALRRRIVAILGCANCNDLNTLRKYYLDNDVDAQFKHLENIETIKEDIEKYDKQHIL